MYTTLSNLQKTVEIQLDFTLDTLFKFALQTYFKSCNIITITQYPLCFYRSQNSFLTLSPQLPSSPIQWLKKWFKHFTKTLNKNLRTFYLIPHQSSHYLLLLLKRTPNQDSSPQPLLPEISNVSGLHQPSSRILRTTLDSSLTSLPPLSSPTIHSPSQPVSTPFQPIPKTSRLLIYINLSISSITQ